MCLAIPGKVIEINGDDVIVDYGGERRKSNISLVEDLRVGEYVILNNKIIISKISEGGMKKTMELIKNG